MRKPLFIMVAVLVLAACSHEEEGSSDPLHDMQEMAVAEAWRDFDADKLDTALLKVDAVLKTAPGNLSAMRLKSMILVSLGRTGEAVKVLEELARCEPGDLDIQHILGTIYFKQEKWEKASKHLEQAMAAPERAEKASELLVVCYENLGQLDRSISLLEKMLKDKPEDPVLLTHTGNLLASSGRYAQAIERFSGALERDSGIMAAHHGLAVSQAAIEKYDDVIKTLNRAISIFPKEPGFRVTLAQTYLQVGEPLEALRTIEQIEEIAGKSKELELLRNTAESMLRARGKPVPPK